MAWYVYEQWVVRRPKKEEPKAWELIVGMIIIFLVIKGLLS